MIGTNRMTAGFTLVELMVTVAVVAILATIAVESYSSYVRRANRTDATRTMMADAQSLQRCYSQNFTYTPAGGCPTPAGTSTSPGGFYASRIGTPSTSTYTIVATPLAMPQTKDSPCAQFTLKSDGSQSALNSAGSDATKTCWGSTN
jgi:type IV pilus assembly protein PilE